MSYTTMAKLSFVKQVRLFYNTDIFFSPHGSALVNLMFARPHSVVIECNPPYFYEIWYSNTALISRLHHIMLATYKRDLKEDWKWKRAEEAYFEGRIGRIRRQYADNKVNPPVFVVKSAVEDAIAYLKRWRFVFEVSDKWSPLFF